MEGGGEGMTAVIQGLPDGLAVMLLNKNHQEVEFRRQRPCLDRESVELEKHFSVIPSSRKGVRTGPLTRKTTANANAQICDGQYASTYQNRKLQKLLPPPNLPNLYMSESTSASESDICREETPQKNSAVLQTKLAHCSVMPTSPPPNLPEFPPQRPEPCRTLGNFEVGGFGSGEHSRSRSPSPTNSHGFRGGMHWPDRGSVCSARPYDYDADAFANSLRKYPSSPERSPSVELLQRLIKLTQDKYYTRASQHSKSMRDFCEKTSPSHRNMNANKSSKNLQTYTRGKRSESPDKGRTSYDVRQNVTRQKGFRSGFISPPPGRSRDSRDRETFDYLNSSIPRPAPGTACGDRQAVRNVIQDSLQEVYGDGRGPLAAFPVCPRIQSRYERHRREHHVCEAPKPACSDEASGSQLLLPWETCLPPGVSTSQDTVKNCCVCNQPMPCSCQSPLLRDLASDNETQERGKLESIVCTWLNQLPVNAKENPHDKFIRDALIKQVIETLGLIKDDEFDVKGREEIDKCIDRMPMWLPNDKQDRERFKHEIADSLFEKIKGFRMRDRFKEVIAKWLENIRFDDENMDKESVAKEFSKTLKEIALNRPLNDCLYRERLKSKAFDMLEALPIQTCVDKNDILNLLTDKLADQPMRLPKEAIKPEPYFKVQSNRFESSIFTSSESFDDIIMDALNEIKELVNMREDIKQEAVSNLIAKLPQLLTDDDENGAKALNEEIRNWLLQLAEDNGIYINNNAHEEFIDSLVKKLDESLLDKEEPLMPTSDWPRDLPDKPDGIAPEQRKIMENRAKQRLSGILTGNRRYSNISHRNEPFPNDKPRLNHQRHSNDNGKANFNYKPRVSDEKYLNDKALPGGKLYPSDKPRVSGQRHLSDEEQLGGKPNTSGQRHVNGEKQSKGKASLSDKPRINDQLRNSGQTRLSGEIQFTGKALLSGKSHSGEQRQQSEERQPTDKEHKSLNAHLNDKPHISSPRYINDERYTTGKANISDKRRTSSQGRPNVKEQPSGKANINNKSHGHEQDYNNINRQLIEKTTKWLRHYRANARNNTHDPLSERSKSMDNIESVLPEIEKNWNNIGPRLLSEGDKNKNNGELGQYSEGSKTRNSLERGLPPSTRNRFFSSTSYDDLLNLTTGDPKLKQALRRDIHNILDQSNFHFNDSDTVESKLTDILADLVMRGIDEDKAKDRVLTILGHDVSAIEANDIYNKLQAHAHEMSRSLESRPSSEFIPRARPSATSTPQKQRRPSKVKTDDENKYISELVTKIQDWINNLNLLNDNEENYHIATDLANDLMDRQKYLQLNPNAKTSNEEELEHVKYQVFKKFNKLVDSVKLNKIISEVTSLMNSVKEISVPQLTKSLGTTGQQSQVHDSNAISQLNDAITKWCNDLPLPDTIDGNIIKQGLANKIILKVGELSMNPQILNDDFLYEDLLLGFIDQQLSMIPISLSKTEAMKASLIDDVNKLKRTVKEKMKGQAYRQQLLDTISKSLPPVENPTEEEQVSFEILKSNLADAFINLHYVADDTKLRAKFKNKINNEITKFVDDYMKHHPSTPISAAQLKTDLYSALKKVEVPGDDSMRSEVERARIKDIIDDWVEQLPMKKQSTAEIINTNKILKAMVQRLYELEKENQSNPDGKYEERLRTEIEKYLNKLPLNEKSFDESCNKLIEHMKNTEHSRIFTEGSRRSIDNVDLLGSSYGISAEDHEHLQRIKARTPGRVASQSRLCGCKSSAGHLSVQFKDAAVNPAPSDNGSQTDMATNQNQYSQCKCPKPRAKSPVQQSPTSSTSLLRNSKPAGITQPRLSTGSQIEISPYVVVKEYFWDSTTDPPELRRTLSSTPTEHRSRECLSPSYIIPQNRCGHQRPQGTRLGSFDNNDEYLDTPPRRPIRRPMAEGFDWESCHKEESFHCTPRKRWSRPHIYRDVEDAPFPFIQDASICECRGKVPKYRARRQVTCQTCQDDPMKFCAKCCGAQCPHPTHFYFR